MHLVTSNWQDETSGPTAHLMANASQAEMADQAPLF